MQDTARQKELDMLEKISDAETVRHLREQEQKRREEEEWKLQAQIMVGVYTQLFLYCALLWHGTKLSLSINSVLYSQLLYSHVLLVTL